MVSVATIFDGTTSTDQIIESSTFENADFLFFETPNLPDDEGYELAVSLSVNIIEDLDGTSVDFGSREIPITFPDNVADTKVLIPVPREVAQTKLQCKLLLITTEAIRLVVHALSSQLTNADVLDQVNQNVQNQDQAEQIIDTVIDIIRLSGGDVTASISLVDNVGSLLDSFNGVTIPDLPPDVDTLSELEGYYSE